MSACTICLEGLHATEELPSLDWVRCFAFVAAAGSYGGAARALGLHRTTVRANVKKLSGYLGLELATSTNRGTHLTPGGAAVAIWAGQVVELIGRPRRISERVM